MNYHDRDMRRAESTVDFQKGLDAEIRSKYPFVHNAETLRRYQEKATPFASFRVETTKPLTYILFLTALQRAADPVDPAYCEHGALHTTFQDTVRDLRIELNSRREDKSDVFLYDQDSVVSIERRIGDKSVRSNEKVTRYILEGEERTKKILVPSPLQLAEELKYSLEGTASQERRVAQVLTRAAAKYGVPFAILTGFYYGISQEELIHIFNNPDRKRLVQAERQKAGVNPKNIRFPNNNQLEALSEVRRCITVGTTSGVFPSRSADAFNQAKEILFTAYRKTGDISQELDQFITVERQVTPIAVFAGMDEVAQNLVSVFFTEPARSDYIDRRYGRGTKLASTRMVTAYYRHRMEEQQTYFTDLFTSKKQSGIILDKSSKK